MCTSKTFISSFYINGSLICIHLVLKFTEVSPQSGKFNVQPFKVHDEGKLLKPTAVTNSTCATSNQTVRRAEKVSCVTAQRQPLVQRALPF